MFITATDLQEQVIKPTLDYLGVWTPEIGQMLLKAAGGENDLGLFARSQQSGLGLFRISSEQHRDIWDRYLAFQPDVASRIRGLASQRTFLSNPDSELQTNLSYSTAIAWLLLRRTGLIPDTPPGRSVTAGTETPSLRHQPLGIG